MFLERMLRPIGSAAAIVAASPALAHGYDAGGSFGEPYHGMHMWSGGWFMGPIMMILFIAIAVTVVVLLVRWLGDTGHGRGAHPSPGSKAPLDILKERFARGEIDKEEFEERRRMLEG